METPLIDHLLTLADDEQPHRLLRCDIFQKPALEAEISACIRNPKEHGMETYNEAKAMWDLEAERRERLVWRCWDMVHTPCSTLHDMWEWSCAERRTASS